MYTEFLLCVIFFGFQHHVNAQATSMEVTSKRGRKSNNFDYNFDDWEETTQSIYDLPEIVNLTVTTTEVDYDLPESPMTEAEDTELPTTSPTAPTDLTTVATETAGEIPTAPTEEATEEPTVVESTTANATTATEATTEISTAPTEETTATKPTTSTVEVTQTTSASPLDVNATASTLETSSTLNDTDLDDLLYNYLTTTPKLNVMTWGETTPVDDESPATPEVVTVHPLVIEVKELSESLKYGFFTTTMITLLKVIAMKDDDDISKLTFAMANEVMHLKNNNRLTMFGPVGQYAIQSLGQVMALSPSDVLRSQASVMIFALTTRKTTLKPEANAVFDLIDNTYTEDDAISVISTIVDIQDFPNTTKTAEDICEQFCEATLFTPYSRIVGTTKEELLVMEVENLMTRAMTDKSPGDQRLERRYGVHTFVPMKDWVSKGPYKRVMNRLRPLRTGTTKKKKKKNYTNWDTTPFVVTDLSYYRNSSLKRRLVRKQKAYKEKWREIRQREYRMSTKRGKTTTTTTTTVKPTMHRSKYYWRKYKLRNLYRMRTTTTTTTTTKKYFWMNRRNDRPGEFSNCSSDSNSNMEENYYKHLDATTPDPSSDIGSKSSDEIDIKTKTDVSYEEATPSLKNKAEKDSYVESKDNSEDDNVFDTLKQLDETKERTENQEDLHTQSSHENVNIYKAARKTTLDSSFKNFEDDKSIPKDTNDRDNKRKERKKETIDSEQSSHETTKSNKDKRLEILTEKEILESKEILTNFRRRYPPLKKPMMVYRGTKFNVRRTFGKSTQINNQNKLKKIKDTSDYSSDEKYLKANVLDAFIHGHENLTAYKDRRRHINEKDRHVGLSDSYSNEEPILKAKVYKAFGYTNNFAERWKKNIS